MSNSKKKMVMYPKVNTSNTGSTTVKKKTSGSKTNVSVGKKTTSGSKTNVSVGKKTASGSKKKASGSKTNVSVGKKMASGSKKNETLEGSADLTTDEIFNELTQDKIIHPEPIAIITMGIPGSGKSTVVKKFIKENLHKIIPRGAGNYDFNEFVNCNPDEILRYITEEDTKLKLGIAARKNASILKKIREADEKLSIIYDGTGSNLPAYKGTINKFHENNYKTILIYVKTNLLIAKNRVKKRSRKVSPTDIQRIYNSLEEPITKKGSTKKTNNIKKFDLYKEMVLSNGGSYVVVDNTFKGAIVESNIEGLTI